MTVVRLKAVATLNTAVNSVEERPLLSLDLIESGTGKLVKAADVPVWRPPASGVAEAKPGDVLFGKLRPYLSKSLLVEAPSYASTELLCLRPTPSTDSRWLAYVVQSRPFVDWTVATSDGTKMPRTSWEKVGQFRIDQPSLDEQQSIANFLDAETACVDELIAKKMRLVKVLGHRLNAAIDLAVDGDGSHWPLVRLRWCTKRIVDGTHGTYVRHASGHPLLSAKNLRDGRVRVTDDESFISNGDYQAIVRSRRFVPGDVLLGVIGGSIGNVARLRPGDPLAFQRSVAAISPDSNYSGDFMEYVALSTRFQDQLRLASNTSAQAGVYLGDLGDLRVPLPPMGDQKALAIRLERESERVRSATATLDRQVDLLVERRQALITAAVTGELAVPGAA